MSQATTVARDRDARSNDGARDAKTQDAATRKPKSKLLRRVLMVGGVLILLVAVLLYWLFTGGSVDITDTYVRAARVSISTDVSGLVKKVDVQDHQEVKAGQVLFRLDPSRFQIAIAAAKANLAQVKQQFYGARHSYLAQVAKVKAQEVLVHNDQLNYNRYAALVRSGSVTRADYDNAKYKLAGAQAQLAALKAQTGVSLAKLSNDPKIHLKKTPQYKAALANLDQAEL
ncbi:MAG TPA: biotin/lipoyl-binding protein, partial [Acetobacteraceae bacterium]|nr:biotin/lipoyl-binding protein [Acetobacteraceae bacterium]